MLPTKPFITVLFIDSKGSALEVKSPGYDIKFDVETSSTKSADTASLTVFGLDEPLRNVAADAEQIEIRASFESPPPMIFKGEIVDVTPRKSDDFLDWIVEVEADDTKSKFRDERFVWSFKSGQQISTALTQIAGSGGMSLDFQGAGRLAFPWSFVGRPRDAMDELCDRLGYRFQISYQKVIVRGEDEPISSSRIPIVSEETGMIGIPSSELNKSKQVEVTVEHRLSNDLFAGGLCQLVTDATTGSRKAPIRSGGIYQIKMARKIHEIGETPMVIMRMVEHR